MNKQEINYVNTKKVTCMGEGGAIGHPLIYLDLSKDDKIMCPYCSKNFHYKKD
jgi:uncharacterized Zn-finger protein